jgi:hypothetical protein
MFKQILQNLANKGSELDQFTRMLDPQKESIEFIEKDGELKINYGVNGKPKTMMSKLSGLNSGDPTKVAAAKLVAENGQLPELIHVSRNDTWYLIPQDTQEKAKRWYQEKYLGAKFEDVHQPIVTPGGFEEEKKSTQKADDKFKNQLVDGKQEEEYIPKPSSLLDDMGDPQDRQQITLGESSAKNDYFSEQLNNLMLNLAQYEPDYEPDLPPDLSTRMFSTRVNSKCDSSANQNQIGEDLQQGYNKVKEIKDMRIKLEESVRQYSNLESNQKIQANNSIPVAKPQVCELAPDANLLSQARLISEEPGHEHLYALPRFSNVEKPQVSKLVPDADVLSQARLISKEPGHEHLYALPRFSNFENDNDHFEGGDFENYDAVDFEAELNGYIDHSPNLI